MTTPTTVARLLELLKPARTMVFVSILCRVINQGLGVAIPAVAISYLFEGGGTILVLVGLAVTKGLFRYLEQLTGHAVAFRMLAQLRGQVFGWVEAAYPSDDDRSGDLAARITGDVDRVEPFYAHTIAPAVAAVLVPGLSFLAVGLWIDPVLALVGGVIALVMLVLVVGVGISTIRVAGPAIRTSEGESAALLTDVIQGYDEVVVLGATERVGAMVEGTAEEAVSLRRDLARTAGVRALIGSALSGLAVVAVLVVGLGRVSGGVLELSGMVVAVVVTLVALGSIRALEQIVPDTEQALAAAARLFELADRQAPVDPVTNGRNPTNMTVRYEGVSVRLGGRTVLDDVDLEIEDGQHVAVVGPSGSGKSTLAEMLLRGRDPDSGRITLGGEPLTSVDTRWLRSKVMLVPQRPDVFHGTIADNLRLAAPDASVPEMMDALERARLGEWVEGTALGLQTPSGVFGATMSGGQRQRLSLARAFLRDASILILDEATSELDDATEAEVLAELMRERGRRTLVTVAHRLHTIVDADLILVVDRGRIVESGIHTDLVPLGGTYAGLWQRHLDHIQPTGPGGT